MIHFNGYPYLERDEHSFNIPGMPGVIIGPTGMLIQQSVSGVMQKELHTMSVTGMTLHEVGEKFHYRTNPLSELNS
jgi:hypothetical protein